MINANIDCANSSYCCIIFLIVSGSTSNDDPTISMNWRKWTTNERSTLSIAHCHHRRVNCWCRYHCNNYCFAIVYHFSFLSFIADTFIIIIDNNDNNYFPLFPFDIHHELILTSSSFNTSFTPRDAISWSFTRIDRSIRTDTSSIIDIITDSVIDIIIEWVR